MAARSVRPWRRSRLPRTAASTAARRCRAADLRRRVRGLLQAAGDRREPGAAAPLERREGDRALVDGAGQGEDGAVAGAGQPGLRGVGQPFEQPLAVPDLEVRPAAPAFRRAVVPSLDGRAPVRRPVVTSTAARGRSRSNAGWARSSSRASSIWGRTALHSGRPRSPALLWSANWCSTHEAGSPVPVSPSGGLGPLAMKSLPNSNAPWRKCTSVKPRAASSAISGASNSRSVTVSRKPATTSRSTVCLPLADDDLGEPAAAGPG